MADKFSNSVNKKVYVGVNDWNIYDYGPGAKHLSMAYSSDREPLPANVRIERNVGKNYGFIFYHFSKSHDIQLMISKHIHLDGLRVFVYLKYLHHDLKNDLIPVFTICNSRLFFYSQGVK